MVGPGRPGQAGGTTSEPAAYPGYRFPAGIIRHAVWPCHVFGLGLRNVELIPAGRGIGVTHGSVRQRRRKSGVESARRLRRRRPRPGGTRHLDEVFLEANVSAERHRRARAEAFRILHRETRVRAAA